MFLILTADYRFWKYDESQVLFLGEWCKIYKDRARWESLEYEVLPYHWNDRERLHADYSYLRDLCRRYIVELSKNLNNVHGLNGSVRHWQIIVGPWLFYFVDTLYDKYLSVKAAAASGKVTGCRTLAENFWNFVPLDYTGFVLLLDNELFHHYLYSRIVSKVSQFPIEPVGIENRSSSLDPSAPNLSLRSLAKTILGSINSVVNSGDTFLLNTYFSPLELCKLSLKIRQIPQFFHTPLKIEPAVLNQEFRKRLTPGIARNEFETILEEFIQSDMPVAYLEGFSETRRRAISNYPKKIRVILTANAHSADEGFKIWAADQVDKGTKLGLIQHGGHYGTGLFSSSEDHELEIADNFFSWGWTTKRTSKVVPTDSPKLIGIKRKIKYDSAGSILIIGNSAPRYSYWLYSICQGPLILDYLEDQERFVQALSKEAATVAKLRLYFLDYGWNEKERWKDMAPQLETYRGPISIYDQLSCSRLCVCTFNTTTFLETMAANYPTVIFWNPRFFELNSEAQPCFEGLRNAGILFYDPLSAAKHVSSICKDPMIWWKSVEVQKAKRDFVEKYARAEISWAQNWNLAIAQLKCSQSDDRLELPHPKYPQNF